MFFYRTKNFISVAPQSLLLHFPHFLHAGNPWGGFKANLKISLPDRYICKSNTIQSRKESVLSIARITALTGRCAGYAPMEGAKRRRTSFPASLTVEAAFILPIFFIMCATILQYTVMYKAAAQFSGLLTTTAQEMAIAAYKEEYEDANHVIRALLSDAWASKMVISKAPDSDAVRNATFINSSYMKDGDFIRLVLTYQAKPKYSLFTLPWTFYVQKAVVRGWTGRSGSSDTQAGESNDETNSNKEVYVTDYGTVYHTDAECSHLKLKIIPITEDMLTKARNSSGHKYKKCRYCGNKSTGHLYINPFGNCWHTTLDCVGLKRSVNTVHLDECDGMQECSDCKKRRENKEKINE